MNLAVNERQIKPVRTWFQGGYRTLNVFRLDNLNNYQFNGSGGLVRWVLLERIVSEIVTATEDHPDSPTYEDVQDTPLDCGEVELPSEVIANWGADDQPIFDYVMGAINVVPVG